MEPQIKPYRSLLYIPGSRERALVKATSLPADGIIFDLEDAVAMDEKANARGLVAETLERRDYGTRGLMVRVNGRGTGLEIDDLAAICAVGPEAILLPKVQSGDDIRWLEAQLAQHPNCAETAIWAMMESPLGVLNAQDIAAASPRLKGFVVGSNDLVKDLSARHVEDRAPIMTSLSLCLLAARAYGLVCVDGVYNAYKDVEGLRQHCVQGRDMGFDGKSLIHPAQLEVANEVFAPSEAEIELARRQIAAFEAAQAEGLGIAVLDGSIVENLHVVTAKRLLARAEAVGVIG
ncbi:MAG: CoA ester lyase [Alphaproteobacteria bacterium]|nr:CoA ester lyase [Alphaproteobacteria bacterium]